MRRYAAIFLLGLFLAILVYPSSLFRPLTTLPDDNDTRLIAYIIGQTQTNLLHHQPLFTGTFFAPYQNTLAYSDLFLTTAVITLPFRLFSTSPVFIYNMALLLLFSLTFTASFLLFNYLFHDAITALFSALLFNFSGFHLIYLPHLQVFSLWLLCLSFYFFLRYQRENKTCFLTLFFIALTAQIADSLFPAYLIFFAVLFLYLEKPRLIKPILIRLLFFLPFWLLLVFPYLKLHFAFPEASRPIRDAAHFSLGLEQIFTQYHSLIFIVLFSLSLLLKSKSSQKHFYLILVFSFIMALGPVVKFMNMTVKILGLPLPLPYTLFYYLFPGFTGFRTPSRFIVLAALAAAIIIGSKITPSLRKLKPTTKLVFLTGLLLLLLSESKAPFPSYAVQTTPPSVYEKVKALPLNAVILELPLKLWNDPNHEIESLRSLYSLYHGHRRFGGFSGFAPLAWVDLVEQIKAHGLSKDNLAQLHLLGITNIVENNRLYSLPDK